MLDKIEKNNQMKELQKTKLSKRVCVGVVTSDKMDKTIVVSISTKKLHRLYKKYIIRIKKCKVHDEKNEAHIGDKVQIVECRPFSRDKCWRLVEILKQAQ